MKTIFFVILTIGFIISGVSFDMRDIDTEIPLEEEIAFESPSVTITTSIPPIIHSKEVTLNPAGMQRCFELGTDCEYQLGCCVWNWENDPPTYSCGCVLYKK